MQLTHWLPLLQQLVKITARIGDVTGPTPGVSDGQVQVNGREHGRVEGPDWQRQCQ
jgi:hypothetical protein